MKPSMFTRRKFIKYSAYGIGTVAVGVAGINSTGKVNYSDPAYLYWNKNSRGALKKESYVVLCGALAASAHNTQPWRFDIEENQVDVYADLSRNLGRADADRRMMSQSVGCAIENISVASQQLGITPEIVYQNDGQFHENGFAAQIRLLPGEFKQDHPMFEAMFQRQTTRAPYLEKTPAAKFITRLESQNDFEELQLHIITNDAQLITINAIHKDAVDAFVADDNAYLDSVRWWRYSREELLEKRDGISIYTSAAPNLVKQYFSMGVTHEDMQGEFGRQGEADLMYKLFDATPMWAAITTSKSTLQNRLNAGRLLERLYLSCAKYDYRIMPIAYACEQAVYANKVLSALQLDDSNELVSIVRIGESATLEKSVRRPLSDIIV